MRRCRIPTLLVLMATTLPVAPVSASDLMRFRGPQIAPGTMSDMATGDFDEDGKVDLAVATYWPAAVQVFRGTGDGAFDAGWSGGAPSGEGWIAAGDVNADGHCDLVRGDGSDDALSVFLGGGDGTFVEQDGGPLGGRTSYLKLHDLDLDGALDVVAAHENDDRVTVRLGTGDGQFAAPIVLELEARPMRFALGDVDGDAIPDLLLPVGSIELRRGLGDGTFGVPEPLMPGGGAVALLDTDGDDDLDVAVTRYFGGTVATVLANDGRGGFTIAQEIEVGEYPVSLEVADLDRDGRQDLLVANLFDESVSFLRGAAGGLADRVVIPTGDEPFQLRAVDLNGDDDPDLLVQSHRAVTVQVAEGAAQFSHNDAIEMDWCVTRMLLADIDHDGRRDALALIRYNQDLHDLAVRRARADGTFGEIERFSVGAGAFTLDVADVTGDGLVDVVTGNRTNEDVTVLPGLPDGDLGPAITISGFSYLFSLATGDLDGDGTDEILVCEWDGLMVVRSAGDGEFEAPVNQGFSAFGPLHILDVDRDGDLDAAYGGVDPRTGLLTAEVALGDGRGGLQAPRSFPMLLHAPDYSWFETEFADLNGDGFVDVVQTSADASEISVLHGTPDGAFGDPILQPAPSGLVEPHLHDMTGNGRLDLIARLEGYGNADFVVLAGNGSGTFGDARSFGLLAPALGISAGGYDVLAADMDDDGDADVLVGRCAGIIVAENITAREAAADADGNGIIGSDDLIALIVAWGPCDGAPCPADLDDDGTVGFGDLAVLLGAWGSSV